MTLTQTEILESLNLIGSPARVVVELSSRELSTERLQAIYLQFAGEHAQPIREPLLPVTVNYLVMQAAAGEALDVAACVARAEAFEQKNPWNFTEAVQREKAALLSEQKKKAVKPPSDDDSGTPTIVRDNITAPPKAKRDPGAKSAFAQAAELLAEAVGHTREEGIALLQDRLDLPFGSAQTYYYKAKKERGYVGA